MDIFKINLLILTICILPFVLHTTGQIQYPTVPCPNLFQYSFNPNVGGYFGLVTIERDGSPISELQVNMSMNTRTPVTSNIKIVVLSKQEEIFYGDTIRYAVTFPLQNVLPKLTLIQFNGKTLCRGEPDPLELGIIQTSMWAKSTITTFSISPQGQKTTQKPSGTFGNTQFFFTIGAQPPQPFNISNNPFIPGITSKQEETTVAQPPQTRPQPKTTTTTTSTTTTTTTTIRPTVSTTTQRNVNQCGVTRGSQNLILGGEGIGPGDFPWLAAIMYRQKSEYKFHCTGNLISNRHVLTAGHCVRYHNAPLFDNEDLIVVLGKLNIENWASGGTIRNAKRVIAHPNYKQNTADYDIAMIFLSEAVPYRPTVRPICLWEGSEDLDEIIGRFGTVVGWGKQNEADEKSSIAQKVVLPVVSQENCLRSNKVYKKYTSSRTFCAGNRDSVSGPCAGDSGAGFMIRDDTTKRWFLRGLVGFSIRDPETLTCDLNHYVVFIDIAKIRTWIVEEMEQD